MDTHTHTFMHLLENGEYQKATMFIQLKDGIHQ